jgi:hypothetical protein
VQPRPVPEPSETARARLWSLENEQDDELWQARRKEGEGTKILDSLSSCSNKLPLALRFLITLRRAVFSSWFSSASFEVILT